jgi:hypothetical protein
MRLALLGVDGQSLQLALAALERGHEFVWLGEVDAQLQMPEGLTSLPDRGEHWQELLDPATADAIIMGTGLVDPARQAARLNELVRQGRSVMVIHPLFAEVLTFFEIDMTRAESGARLLHFNPLADSPLSGLVRHRQAAGTADLGNIEQLSAVRFLEDRTRESVLFHFARDVELLERIAGRLDRVGAHGASEAPYAALSVQLSAAGSCPVRWMVSPPTEASAFELTVIYERGRLVAAFDDEGSLQSLRRIVSGATASLLTGDLTTAAQAAMMRLEGAGGSTWPEALHAMELADSIEISLRRGRMIDVHQQQLTEQLAFRGTMAAAGCGVLLVLPPLFLLVGWMAGLLGIETAEYWPHALLATLAAFLALQVLPKLVLPRSSEVGNSEG